MRDLKGSEVTAEVRSEFSVLVLIRDCSSSGGEEVGLEMLKLDAGAWAVACLYVCVTVYLCMSEGSMVLELRPAASVSAIWV